MNGCNFAFEDFDALLDTFQVCPPFTAASLVISPWLAASILQKAIRRGREDFALAAAATLLRDDPARFWRRCGIIAYEDIGVADLNVVEAVTTALSGKMFRAKFGGECRVASAIVTIMTRATKCRAADDLIMVVERHPFLAEARTEFAHLSIPALIDIATGKSDLRKRALALWYAIGTTNVRSDHLVRRSGDPEAVFDALLGIGLPQELIDILRQGLQRVRQILCPLLSLLYPIAKSEASVIVDDPLSVEPLINNVPCWAFDMFVREGRRALWAFLDQDCASGRWINAQVPRSSRIALLGYIVFAVEGGLLRSRCDWPTAAQLRHWAELESQGPWCPDATEIIELLRADLPLLNEVRAHVC